MTERWTLAQYKEFRKTGNPPNNTAVRAPDRKPVRPNDQAGAVQNEKVSSRFDSVDVRIHVTRKRRVDRDATRCKTVLDGIVRGGVIKDDSEDEVKTVSITHEKGSEESTVIDITPTSEKTGAFIYAQALQKTA